MQGYNEQAVADCESQVIVAQDLTQEENDIKQLGPMLKRCEEQAGGATWRGAGGCGGLERGEREAGERRDGAIYCDDERLEAAQGDEGGPATTGADSQGIYRQRADGAQGK